MITCILYPGVSLLMGREGWWDVILDVAKGVGRGYIE